MNDAMSVLSHFVPCDYQKKIKVCDGLEIRFVDAGHLLGSSSIEMWVRDDDGTEVKLAFPVISDQVTVRSSKIRNTSKMPIM